MHSNTKQGRLESFDNVPAYTQVTSLTEKLTLRTREQQRGFVADVATSVSLEAGSATDMELSSGMPALRPHKEDE